MTSYMEQLNHSLEKIKDDSFKKNMHIIINECRDKNVIKSIIYALLLAIPFCFFSYMALYIFFIRGVPFPTEYSDLNDFRIMFKEIFALALILAVSMASFWGLLSVNRNYRSAYFYQTELWNQGKINSVLDSLDENLRDIFVKKLKSIEIVSNKSIYQVIYDMCQEKIDAEEQSALKEHKQMISNL